MQLLEEMYGMPWIAPLPPYGRAGTRHWMQEIARALPPSHGEATEAEIDRVTHEDFLHLSDKPFMGLRGARHIEEQLWNGNILRRKIILS